MAGVVGAGAVAGDGAADMAGAGVVDIVLTTAAGDGADITGPITAAGELV